MDNLHIFQELKNRIEKGYNIVYKGAYERNDPRGPHFRKTFCVKI